MNAETARGGIKSPDASRTQSRLPWAALGQALLIACAGLPLLARCWDANFISYDDTAHIHDIPQVFGKAPIIDLFKTPTDTYLPITYISYRLDYELFGRRMHARGNENWAPPIRLMSWFYHSCAAVMLWRLLLLLGATAGEALFIALAFAAHPMACETVGWVSERKSALAAMFGFAALFAYLRGDGRPWRVPLTWLLYTLALFSKPSVLGLLPLFAILELYGGAAGVRGEQPLNLRPNRSWIGAGVRFLPLAAVAVFDLRMNLAGHASQLIPPPGGSALTGAMTDAEILLRYLRGFIAPTGLSIAYYVKPIVSLLDVRFSGYLALLALLAGGSIWLARSSSPSKNGSSAEILVETPGFKGVSTRCPKVFQRAGRRRAVLGWLWFVAALGTNLNLIGTPYPMQDRYLYFSMPGLLLVLVETAAGIQRRVPALRPASLRAAAAIAIVALCVLSFFRSEAFQSTLTLFTDAVQKQPLCSWARYGLTQAYAEEWARMSDTHDDPKLEELRATMRRLTEDERLAFLERCPDARRNRVYLPMALEAGKYAAEQKRFGDAEKYFKLCIAPPADLILDGKTQAAALRELARLALDSGAQAPDAGAQVRSAYALAEMALQQSIDIRYSMDESELPADQARENREAVDQSRLVRARAALAWAREASDKGDAVQAGKLRGVAKADLEAVPADSAYFQEARKMMKEASFE